MVYFSNTEKLLRKLESKRGKEYDEAVKGVVDELMDISSEVTLMKEVKDILDELHIIDTLLSDQAKVLEEMDANLLGNSDGSANPPLTGDVKSPNATGDSQYDWARPHQRARASLVKAWMVLQHYKARVAAMTDKTTKAAEDVSRSR